MLPSPASIPAPLVGHLASLNLPTPSALGASFFDFPNTSLAKRAEEFVRKILPAWAAHHSFRTYAFAIGIANYAGWDTGDKAQELGFDKELIFLACALHEIGFNPSAQKSPLSLELWGAIKARQWLLDQTAQVVEECQGSRTAEAMTFWADEVCEAIARHTIEFRDFSSRVRLTGALVTLGAGQDLMGLSTKFMNPEDIKSICETWPRLGYCDGLKAIAKIEVGNKPACLFEDCVAAFDPGMYGVACFDGLQGVLEKEKEEN
ncbi:hypothetical protein BGZ61DRAFT_487498 [Ilyonectria robusta]|uniref:uncharacterized protein n=1 Tax=Ilyonectria robusta TaxID=1079257 RepID=UPI001E8E2B6F|nr:uncharacterized protein BGZ61DRAFT_487498 [Ilyonectria robusta]KAH8652583.1 hypothetical protein BGZ61DRAFT_487498 [Ilyonectria robusta]